MIDVVRGVIRVRRWPKKRGRPRSASQRFWVDWFRQANLLAKYASAYDQTRAIELSEGKPLYPRDVLLQAMRGRLYNWTDENGWRWFSVAAIGDISEALDVLAQTVGSVLVRATDRWRDAGAGAAGDVLKHQGPGAAPIWLPATGGGGYRGGCIAQKTANQSIPNATTVALTWNTELYDTDNIHDNAVNNSRMVVPAGIDKVQFFGGVRWTSNSNAARLLFVYKNGALFPAGPYVTKRAYGSSDTQISSGVVQCVAGDYFELMAYQNSGVALNVLTSLVSYFNMQLIT